MTPQRRRRVERIKYAERDVASTVRCFAELTQTDGGKAVTAKSLKHLNYLVRLARQAGRK